MRLCSGTFVEKARPRYGRRLGCTCLSAGADRRAVPVRVVLSGIPAEAVMVIGYFLYEMGMECRNGQQCAAAAATAVAVGIPMNIVQGVVGVIVWCGPASGAEPAQGHRHCEERLISIEPLPLFIFLFQLVKTTANVKNAFCGGFRFHCAVLPFIRCAAACRCTAAG